MAFHLAGGEGELWVRSHIPSDAASDSAGPSASPAPSPPTGSARRLRRRSPVVPRGAGADRELEGHADNVAASLFGGVVATADGRAVRVPLAFDPAIVVWVPSFTTSTDESRTEARR